jgi:hypothetical protein
MRSIELSGFLALCDLKIGKDVVICESINYDNNIFRLVIPLSSNKERMIIAELFEYIDHIQEETGFEVAKAHLKIPYYAITKITTNSK